MTQYVDHSYFQALAERSPDQICARASCVYDEKSQSYIVTAWGHEYQINPEARTINLIEKVDYEPHPFFSLFLIYHLLRIQDSEVKGQWISEKDLPGGTAFFRGPHEVPTFLITQAFANDIQKFKHKCDQLGGTPIDLADAAYVFDITPKISVAILYWMGDDDFSPEAKLLFDQSIGDHLTLDIIFSLAIEVCKRIGNKSSDY